MRLEEFKKGMSLEEFSKHCREAERLDEDLGIHLGKVCGEIVYEGPPLHSMIPPHSESGISLKSFVGIKKFQLYEEFTLTIPENIRLIFRKVMREAGLLREHDLNITSLNFLTVLTPGKKFTVKPFRIKLWSQASSQDILLLMKSQRGTYVGDWGTILAYYLEEKFLYRGHEYFSPSIENKLWENSSGQRVSLYFNKCSIGKSYLRLGKAESKYGPFSVILVFCKH